MLCAVTSRVLLRWWRATVRWKVETVGFLTRRWIPFSALCSQSYDQYNPEKNIFFALPGQKTVLNFMKSHTSIHTFHGIHPQSSRPDAADPKAQMTRKHWIVPATFKTETWELCKLYTVLMNSPSSKPILCSRWWYRQEQDWPSTGAEQAVFLLNMRSIGTYSIRFDLGSACLMRNIDQCSTSRSAVNKC